MVNSVRYKASTKARGGGVVTPQGTRPDGTRNAKVLFVQIYSRDAVNAADPLGVDDALEAEMVALAEREIARQIQTGEVGIFEIAGRLSKGKAL